MQQERPDSENVVKKASKWVPIEYPSSLEELLNRLFVKRLQYRIRQCLRMFAAHLVACKMNICVSRGCNIGANMVPNAHAENGVTFNRKVSKMISKCGPEGVPKTDKRQYQTVISDFGRALVRVLSPPVVLDPDRCMGGRMPAKRGPNGVVNQARVAHKGHLRGTFGASQCFLNPRDFGTTHCRHHFSDIFG